MNVQERFLNYVSVDTNSDENCESCPSTQGQWTLARKLEAEMKELGRKDVRCDEHAYVYGFIPANTEGMPAIGLIAHMDTSSAVPGSPIRPRILHYEGGDICLNEEKGIVMRERTSSAWHRTGDAI